MSDIASKFQSLKNQIASFRQSLHSESGPSNSGSNSTQLIYGENKLRREIKKIYFQKWRKYLLSHVIRSQKSKTAKIPNNYSKYRDHNINKNRNLPSPNKRNAMPVINESSNDSDEDFDRVHVKKFPLNSSSDDEFLPRINLLSSSDEEYEIVRQAQEILLKQTKVVEQYRKQKISPVRQQMQRAVNRKQNSPSEPTKHHKHHHRHTKRSHSGRRYANEDSQSEEESQDDIVIIKNFVEFKSDNSDDDEFFEFKDQNSDDDFDEEERSSPKKEKPKPEKKRRSRIALSDSDFDENDKKPDEIEISPYQSDSDKKKSSSDDNIEISPYQSEDEELDLIPDELLLEDHPNPALLQQMQQQQQQTTENEKQDENNNTETVSQQTITENTDNVTEQSQQTQQESTQNTELNSSQQAQSTIQETDERPSALVTQQQNHFEEEEYNDTNYSPNGTYRDPLSPADDISSLGEKETTIITDFYQGNNQQQNPYFFDDQSTYRSTKLDSEPENEIEKQNEDDVVEQENQGTNILIEEEEEEEEEEANEPSHSTQQIQSIITNKELSEPEFQEEEEEEEEFNENIHSTLGEENNQHKDEITNSEENPSEQAPHSEIISSNIPEANEITETDVTNTQNTQPSQSYQSYAEEEAHSEIMDESVSVPQQSDNLQTQTNTENESNVMTKYESEINGISLGDDDFVPDSVSNIALPESAIESELQQERMEYGKPVDKENIQIELFSTDGYNVHSTDTDFINQSTANTNTNNDTDNNENINDPIDLNKLNDNQQQDDLTDGELDDSEFNEAKTNDIIQDSADIDNMQQLLDQHDDDI